MVMRLLPGEFEKLVAEGLKLVPDEFRPFLDNVHVVVEEEPGADLLEKMGVPPDETLFGLYTGMPLTQRSIEYSGFPDRISIFRRPFLDEFDNPDEIRHEVARTVLHEIAHHFGISDDRLAELGWG
jgi:predicted Zn-dependent protease with MMP-like domain